MVVEGISKLPISIKKEEVAPLLMKLANMTADIGRLDEKFKRSILKSDLINTLALKESVQSTRIEGTQVTFTTMIEQSHKTTHNQEYLEVTNYQKALAVGQERIANGYPLTTRLILELHAILMAGEARGTKVAAGEFRKVPNWIGPTKRREDAVYIPVPANEIEQYLVNWETYANLHPYGEAMTVDHLSSEHFILDEHAHPLLKVAILHAQFESIHPFLDGNGRLGRIIIALYMMQAKQISSPIFFVSEELEKQRAKYYHLLNGTRGAKPNWFAWLQFFLDASARMTEKLNILLDKAEDIASKGLQQCETLIEEKIYVFTFREPNVTAVQVADVFGIATTTARRALNELSDKGLLFKDTAKRRNIEYLNYDVLDLIDN